MSIELQWDPVVKNVVYWTIRGHWTWHEFNDTFHKELEMIRVLDGQRWDVIGDFLEAPGLPPGAGGVRQVVRAIQQAQTVNFGVLVAVTRSTFIRTMVEVAVRANPSIAATFKICDTPGAARELISKIRQSDREGKAPTPPVVGPQSF